MKVKVYRVETPSGYGPYHCPERLAYHKSAAPLTDWISHPAPEFDNIAEWNEEHRFGFISIEQLKDWFHSKARKYLQVNNCKVVVYEVDTTKILIGGRQVAFIYDGATVVDELRFHEPQLSP